MGDSDRDADWLADKVRALRVFPDADSRMNVALEDREVLCVSQFTLYGDARRGNRPSYVTAAPPETAEPLYERFCQRLAARRGVFGAHMQIELVADGPVTLLLESRYSPRTHTYLFSHMVRRERGTRPRRRARTAAAAGA